MDDNIFFAGGSSQFELTKGVAKVFALTFDEDIDFICDIVLPNNIVNTMGVSDIKRMKGTDVIFCGCNAAIFVVEWTGSHFVILHQIEEIHSCKLHIFGKLYLLNFRAIEQYHKRRKCGFHCVTQG